MNQTKTQAKPDTSNSSGTGRNENGEVTDGLEMCGASHDERSEQGHVELVNGDEGGPNYHNVS